MSLANLRSYPLQQTPARFEKRRPSTQMSQPGMAVLASPVENGVSRTVRKVSRYHRLLITLAQIVRKYVLLRNLGLRF